METRPAPRVILNPKARRGKQWSRQIAGLLEGWASHIVQTDDPSALTSTLSDWVKEGAAEIWVGGGDGTIRQAAKVLARTPVTLGILPLGTGNALANELGIPLQPDRMVFFLRDEAVARPIDVGVFNDEVFVNVATIGISSKVAQALATSSKDVLGVMAYLPALVTAAAESRPIKMEIQSNGETFIGRVLQFVAASTSLHGGPFPVTESSSIGDGLLSMYLVKSKDPDAIWRYGAALLFGRHTDLAEVVSHETKEIVIHLVRERSFVLDGDLVTAKDARISILPAALTVLAAPPVPEYQSPTG